MVSLKARYSESSLIYFPEFEEWALEILAEHVISALVDPNVAEVNVFVFLSSIPTDAVAVHAMAWVIGVEPRVRQRVHLLVEEHETARITVTWLNVPKRLIAKNKPMESQKPLNMYNSLNI